MHSEYYEITKEASDTINDTIEGGGKIVAVGTTSTRHWKLLLRKKAK